jgi:hypothetical protein
MATPPAGVVSKSGISQRGRGRPPPQAGDLCARTQRAASASPKSGSRRTRANLQPD